MQIIPTLRSKVQKWDLLRAIWSPRLLRLLQNPAPPACLAAHLLALSSLLTFKSSRCSSKQSSQGVPRLAPRVQNARPNPEAPDRIKQVLLTMYFRPRNRYCLFTWKPRVRLQGPKQRTFWASSWGVVRLVWAKYFLHPMMMKMMMMMPEYLDPDRYSQRLLPRSPQIPFRVTCGDHPTVRVVYQQGTFLVRCFLEGT